MTTMQKVYLDAQAACGIKPGDWVKVLKKAQSNAGWQSAWIPNMDSLVGGIYQVKEVDDFGINLIGKDKEDSDFSLVFPYFVLEKVDLQCPFKAFAFDRVLVRDSNDCEWIPDLYAGYSCNKALPYRTIGGTGWRFCIPYEGNEHLAFTKNALEA